MSSIIRKFSLSVTSIVAFGCASLASAQAVKLPVIVDGSKTPEKVPDDLAYRHFFSAVAEHPLPTDQEAARQSAWVRRIGFAEPDRRAFINRLAQFRVQLDSIEFSILKEGQTQVLQASITDAVAKVRSDLNVSMSRSGVDSLDNFIRANVKNHIVIYGGTLTH